MKLIFQLGGTLDPWLRKRAEGASDRRAVLEAMGLELVAVTHESFSMPAARPAPWAPVKKTDGQPLVSRHPTLSRSFRAEVMGDKVVVGTDRTYAAYHQFGTRPYRIEPVNKKALWWRGLKHPVRGVNHPGLPARPFFPVVSGSLTARALNRIRAIVDAKLRAMGA